jgi:hypothetical protein
VRSASLIILNPDVTLVRLPKPKKLTGPPDEKDDTVFFEVGRDNLGVELS